MIETAVGVDSESTAIRCLDAAAVDVAPCQLEHRVFTRGTNETLVFLVQVRLVDIENARRIRVNQPTIEQVAVDRPDPVDLVRGPLGNLLVVLDVQEGVGRSERDLPAARDLQGVAEPQLCTGLALKRIDSYLPLVVEGHIHVERRHGHDVDARVGVRDRQREEARIAIHRDGVCTLEPEHRMVIAIGYESLGPVLGKVPLATDGLGPVDVNRLRVQRRRSEEDHAWQQGAMIGVSGVVHDGHPAAYACTNSVTSKKSNTPSAFRSLMGS